LTQNWVKTTQHFLECMFIAVCQSTGYSQGSRTSHSKKCWVIF